MRNNILLSTAVAFTFIGSSIAQNCDINANATPLTITCGQSTTLSAYGSSNGSVVLDEDFNSGGFGAGWGSTPGATSFSNPCSPGGVDGTPHAWMDNNTSVPRTLTSAPYDLSAATAGVTICFDLLFAEQGDAAPCEGPDEPDEGVFLQYSTNGGATWIDIHYFDPNGGNDPQLTNWNNWCFSVPAGAITSNTMFQWHQTADSGADYDHWGIDNVQIFQNDINAEVVWLHDGYSYGIGNPGGDNPTPVSPIATTTYTAQITTGAGDVCTADVTVIVVDPVYDVNITAAPTTICDGDCATISGTAQVVLDPGGLETYENNEFELVASGSAGVNINVQGINTNSIYDGLIQNVTINGFSFSGSSLCTNFGGCPCGTGTVSIGQTCTLDASSFTVTLTSPGGCTIILAPAGVANGNYTDVVFVPVGGTAFNGSFPGPGPWDPQQPFSNLNGCDPNGVWELSFDAPGLGFGIGTLFGWSITFDDPPIYAPVDVSWSPITGLSNPSSINTDACPVTTTDYELTLTNGTAGCATYTETFTITVDPCTGCTPPAQVINPLSTCSPGTVSLPSAIGGGSVAATLSYHGTQLDAQNDVSPIATTVGTSGSYWVRAEDPTDPTCFDVYEIVVTINPLDDASFTLTDYCAGTANSATGIATPGGTFAFNPVPGGGVTINPATGSITNGVAGSTYTIEYTTAGACPATSTETVNVTSQDDASFTLTDYCAGSANSATGIVTPGGTFAFNPVPGGGVTINPSTGSISNGVSGATYTVEYTTAGACSASTTETVNVTSQDDASFTLTDYCAGSANSATGIVTPGGTFAFNPVPGGGVTINPTTGSISNGVSGATYTVEYTTTGACSASTTETVTVTAGFTYNVSVVDENCGAGDGEISLTPVGGTPVYTYSIDGGTTTGGPSFTGLSAGNFNILITDQNGCTATGNEVVANLGGAIIDNIIPVNESCPGACDGSISVSVSGGNPPYTYQWYDNLGTPIGTNSNMIDNLCAGDYSVEVSDAAGGTTQLFYDDFETGAPGWNLASVQGPEGIDANYFEVDDDEGGVVVGGCGIAGNGNATLHITSVFFAGGGAAYDAGGLCGILFCPQTNRQAESPMINTIGQTGLTLNFDFIAGGDIPNDQATVWYNDGFGWTQLGAPLFSGTGACAPQGIWTAYSAPLPASCENIANLQIAIRWQNNDDGVGTDPSVAINNLEVVTSSSAACASTDFATLTAPVADDASFTLTNFCAGAANAATGIVTPGGTFDFNPNPLDGSTINAGTGEITDPVAGTTYTIEYTTPGACPVSSIETVDAQDCCNIVLDTISTVSPTCGQADGEIFVQAVGGDGNYTFSLNGGPFAASNLFIGLTSGSYDIEVQDGTGTCSDIITVQLSDMNAPVITAVNLVQPLCNGDLTGEIEVIANGGVGALTYGIGIGAVPVATNGTGIFTGLGAENYTIVVSDMNGCIASSNGVIVDPPVVTIDVVYTDVTCFGANDGTITITGGGGTGAYNYSIDNGLNWSTNINYTGLSPQLYQVIVEDANGCQSVVEDITIVESGTLVVDPVVVDESCVNSCDGSITWNVAGGNAPYTYVYNGINAPSNSVNDLCPGVYNYTITDNSGCATVGSNTIQPGVLVQPSIVSVVPDGCTDVCDGEVTITSNTGVVYTLDGVSNGTGVFTDLCEGNKVITVTDANGCSNTVSVLVTTTPQTVANFTHLPSSVTIFENTVNFTNETINADQYIWEISGDNGYYVTYNTVDIEHEFPSDTGEYVICLTAINSVGCQDEYCISLVVEDEIVVFVPNSFTPDGDEYNQTFRAYVNGVDLYDFDFLIFNRWGELIWESHDAEIGWDGTYKGKLVQAGTYTWRITVKDIEFDYRKTYTGHVNMLK